MAFDWNVVALSWREGVYAVVEKQDFSGFTEIDWSAVEAAHSWSDVSENGGYQDFVMTLNGRQLEPFLVSKRAREFFARTRARTFVYLIHRAEWESGLNE